MATIVKRPRAELDLLDIWDYIAGQEPQLSGMRLAGEIQ